MASRSKCMISHHGNAQAAERRQRDQAVSSGEPTAKHECAGGYGTSRGVIGTRNRYSTGIVGSKSISPST